MKILTVIGARPQFVKAAMVSKAVADLRSREPDAVTEDILHTGQHYDPNMSEIFFSQMGIPRPAAQLDCGGQSHGAMTGRMLEALEQEMMDRKPDWVLIYGDTNSTLAGALAAAKLHIPVAHVEAGLRSFNKRMPEEINRIMADHVSRLLLCPTSTAIRNLASEGITEGVHHVGDVMYDAALLFGELADRQSSLLETLRLEPSSYFLATVHRQENTESKERMEGIVKAFDSLATHACPLVLPLHPRTAAVLSEQQLSFSNPAVKIIDPVSFLDMVKLERNAALLLTDSGGIQKEAYFHGVPCITLRDETEWVETAEAGWNQVVGASCPAIVEAAGKASKGRPISEYGEGRAAEEILELMRNG